MRLSDILKKTSGNDQTAVQQPQAAPAPKPVDSPAAPTSSAQTPRPSAIPPQTPVASASAAMPSATDVYAKAISEIKTLIIALSKGEKISQTVSCVEQIVSLINSGNDEIVILADRATPDLYLYAHCVNVCIYTTFIGKGMGMDRAKLLRLAYAALFHDLCLSKHLALITRNAKLEVDEMSKIRELFSECVALVDSLPDLPVPVKAPVLDVMVTMNERTYGTGGQPTPLSDESAQYIKIIAITDIYEALTHPRPHRDRFLPHDAIKSMIGSAENNFDPAILKAFIEINSLYPLGSYVRLNSGEVARVIGINHGLPTRPRVVIIADNAGNRVSQVKQIDLGANAMLFVKEAVDETKLKLADKKQMLELKAIRWWVKSL